MTDNQLNDWRAKALQFEQQINGIVIGQPSVVRNIVLAVFARGHVLLEGQVGVGKTTLLRAIAHGLGGEYQRVEGTIDLMPADLVYYTYLDEAGKPRVDPGPLLKQGSRLATFFFNEINRARPQVHSLLLRAMAERSINAFNRDYEFPHMQVFADRNRVEKEETFELPAAAKDRFMFEIGMATPTDDAVLDELMFNQRFHDVDRLIAGMETGGIAYYELNDLAVMLQESIQGTPKLRAYALALWKASHYPQDYGIELADVDMSALLQAGASPRGMSYFIRAAKVRAWLEGRNALLPEDLQAVYQVTMAHRIFLSPMYAYRKDELMPELINGILNQIAAP
ncbi:MoxR family ATPase [Methylobacter sp. Wu1]|uniref:AAA family ATPase n=1 Tax=Methylobacter sp. Wu1 TaxID=3119359 RepID=UPI002F93F317